METRCHAVAKDRQSYASVWDLIPKRQATVGLHFQVHQVCWTKTRLLAGQSPRLEWRLASKLLHFKTLKPQYSAPLCWRLRILLFKQLGVPLLEETVLPCLDHCSASLLMPAIKSKYNPDRDSWADEGGAPSPRALQDTRSMYQSERWADFGVGFVICVKFKASCFIWFFFLNYHIYVFSGSPSSIVTRHYNKGRLY